MKKILPVFTVLAFFCQILMAQPSPKREFRGAWVASYFGIDWPNRNQTPQQQRNAFIELLNHHQQIGTTALFVQVRSQSDALYPSAIEPWGFYLTPLKLDGNEPAEAWDPMQFMIDECHKRGIEFHAWLNPYRAIGNIANAKYFSPEHVSRKHPEWLLSSSVAEKIMDPGLPQVRDRIKDVVLEIVNNYDVDGIQFDDYFYPNSAYNDDATFAEYSRGFTNKSDWRRDNVNLMVAAVSQSIKAAKPWVEFGISPSGIWRNGGEGSATTGLQHYVSLYADSRKWLQEGWVDYLCPQVYWYIGQPGADYKVLIPWWNNNAYGRLIYIGMGGYKVGVSTYGTIWQYNNNEIPNQIRMNRDAAYANISGQAIYNTTSLRNNFLGFRDSIRQNFYNVPALQPLMPWIDAAPPLPATALQATYTGGVVTLNWNNPPEATAELDKVKKLVVYRSENEVVDFANAANILAITPSVINTFEDKTAEAGKVYYYSVTTLDRLANESTGTNQVLVCTSVPQITDYVQALNLCEVASGNYTIPAITASSNCNELHYEYTIAGATTRSGHGNDASGVFAVGTSTITWTITDGAGNKVTSQSVITVNTNPVVTIDDAFALPSGVLPNTIYNGYTPAASITLNASASGGKAPYSYEWSSGSTTATATVAPLTGTTYMVTASDENGCKASAEKEIAVIDVRAGKAADKVLVCHKLDVQNNLEVEPQDVAEHLAHGDMLGSCVTSGNVAVALSQPATLERKLGKLAIQVYPNPSHHSFTIRFNSTNTTGTVNLHVMDVMGRTVENFLNLANNTSLQLGQQYKQGIYFVEITNGTDKTILKLVKQ